MSIRVNELKDTTQIPEKALFQGVSDAFRRVVGLVKSVTGYLFYRLFCLGSSKHELLGRIQYAVMKENASERVFNHIIIKKANHWLQDRYKDQDWQKSYVCLQDGYKGQDWQKIDATKKIIFMPVVLKRSAINHMVMVVYNEYRKELEIYDPQAKPLEDLLKEKLLCSRDLSPNIKVRTLEDYINQKIGSLAINTLRTNHIRQQYDIHSCGMFAATYMCKRLEGVLAKDIMEEGKLTITDVNELRKSMVAEFDRV